MFEGIITFFKKLGKGDQKGQNSKETAKERLHLVLMQDRANVSADFLEMMKQEIIDVIKKYIDVDEQEIDVKLTHKTNEDGTSGAPALYANIPIVSVKNENKIKSEITEKVKELNKNSKEEPLNEKKEDTIDSKNEVNKEAKEQQRDDVKKDDNLSKSELKNNKNTIKNEEKEITESSVKQNKKQEKNEDKKTEKEIKEVEDNIEENKNSENSKLKKDENKKQSKKNAKVASKTK